MSGQATVIGFCGPPGSITLPAGLRWLRMAIRLALCVFFALTLGTAWAHGGGGGSNGNGGAMLSATQPVPVGTAAAASAAPAAGAAAAAAHPWLTVAHIIVMPWVTVLLLVAGCCRCAAPLRHCAAGYRRRLLVATDYRHVGVHKLGNNDDTVTGNADRGTGDESQPIIIGLRHHAYLCGFDYASANHDIAIDFIFGIDKHFIFGAKFI